MKTPGEEGSQSFHSIVCDGGPTHVDLWDNMFILIVIKQMEINKNHE